MPCITTCTHRKHLRGVGCSSFMCFGAGALWSSNAKAAWRSPFFKNVHTLGVDVRRSLGATHSRMLVLVTLLYAFLFVFLNIVCCSCLIWGSGPLDAFQYPMHSEETPQESTLLLFYVYWSQCVVEQWRSSCLEEPLFQKRTYSWGQCMTEQCTPESYLS